MNDEKKVIPYEDVAVCNLYETVFFPYSEFRVKIRSDDMDIPCFHIESLIEGFDIKLYLPNGNLMEVVKYGTRATDDKFGDVVKSAKEWLKLKPAHPKIRNRTNRDNLELMWEAEHCDEYFIVGNLYIDPWLTSNIGTKHTGVDGMLWVSCRQRKMQPLILVGFDGAKNSSIDIAVSIEGVPKILTPKNAEIPSALWTQIIKWIELNREVLLMHWNDQLSSIECLEKLKKI